jgi:alcohol dehydrogenase
MIDAFSYSLNTAIHFGFGKLRELPALLDGCGVRCAVLVCDRFFAAMGETLKESTPQIAAVFSDVEPNPQLSGVKEVVRLVRETGADSVIALGGGSSIDTAKFAAACACSDKTPDAHFDGAPFTGAEKIIAVPTTAGTGSEVTAVSVVSRGEEKKTVHNPAFQPTACIVDPALTMSVPPRTTLITGLDAFTHAIEAFWSVRHSALTDALAVEAMRVILANLEASYEKGTEEARTAMAYGSLLAGLAFSNAKTAACHACSYPLSMYHHLPHGEACAFTLDSLIRLNADDRLQNLAKTLGFSGCDALADEIYRLKVKGGLRVRFADCEGDVDLDRLAKESAEHMLMQNNPVKLDEAALKAMFKKLM